MILQVVLVLEALAALFSPYPAAALLFAVLFFLTML